MAVLIKASWLVRRKEIKRMHEREVVLDCEQIIKGVANSNSADSRLFEYGYATTG